MGDMVEDIEDPSSEDLSESTIAVLCFLGVFSGLVLVLMVYRLLQPVFNRQPARGRTDAAKATARKPGKSKPKPLAVELLASQERSQPQKGGISLKQLVKQSHQSAKPQHSLREKVAKHPLFLNALKGHQDALTGFAFSPNGSLLATACEDRELRVFQIADDVTSPKMSFWRTTLKQDPVDVAFGAQPDLFVLSKGGLDSAVLQKFNVGLEAKGEALQLAWEVKDVHGKELGKGLRGGLTTHGHSLALSFSVQTDLEVYNSSGTRLAGINSSGLTNHGAAMSGDGRFFGAATFTSDVKLHEVQYTRAGELRGVHKVMNLQKAHNGQVLCLAFSPDSKKVVTASNDGTWAVWSIDVQYQQHEDPRCLLKRHQETGDNYRHLSFGPGGVIAAAFGDTLHFLDGRSGTLLETVEAHDAPITALDWSPAAHKLGKGRTAVLATCSLDRSVRFWRAPLL